jgi:PKD domain
MVLLGMLALAVVAIPSGVAAPPSNDNFSDAMVITSLPFNNTVSISEATTESGEPLSWFGQSRTVWYSFTPTSDLMMKADAGGSDYVTAFWSLYRADSSEFAGLTKIASGSYTPSTVQLQGGVTYYIQGGDNYPYGWVSTFGINLKVVLPPANDNFADAIAFSTVPFSDSPDLTAATVEPGEPMGGGSFTQSAWYAFTPTTTGSYGAFGIESVNVYTGTSLTDLTRVAYAEWPGLYFYANAGTTYYLQKYPGVGSMTIDVVPPPAADFTYAPVDPSTLDDTSFSYWNGGYWDPTVTGYAWDFGDGATATGSPAPHRYTNDGDYTVTITVYARGGRSNTATKTVQVRTHDVTILSLVAPAKGQVSKQGVITVGIGNTRYPDMVQVDLYKVTQQGDQLVGTTIQSVAVMKLKKAVSFSFNYVFTSGDLALGKVPFKAVATIQGARDALSSDNVATSPPTLVTK